MKMDAKEKKGASPFWYLLGGAAVGTALGMLYAPKAGKEIRHDLADWSQRNAERGKQVFSQLRRGSKGKAPLEGTEFARSANGAETGEPGRV